MKRLIISTLVGLAALAAVSIGYRARSDVRFVDLEWPPPPTKDESAFHRVSERSDRIRNPEHCTCGGRGRPCYHCSTRGSSDCDCPIAH